MHEPVLFALCLFDLDVCAPRLKILKVAARRHFKPLLHTGGVHFEIVTFGRGKTEITRTELEDPVGKLEQLDYLTGVGGQCLQLIVGLGGINDLDHLDLVELVHTQETPGIRAVTPRLPAETRTVSGVFRWEITRWEKIVSFYVRNRHFGGGYQKEVVDCAVVHILFHLGKLPGPNH